MDEMQENMQQLVERLSPQKQSDLQLFCDSILDRANAGGRGEDYLETLNERADYAYGVPSGTCAKLQKDGPAGRG